MFLSWIRRWQAPPREEDSDLERLQSIEIQTRRRIQAHLLGETESRRRGLGFEFMEHRRYQPGDDYRRIDWNVTSRLRYPFVKRFVADKEVQVWLVIDLSSSMFFGSRKRSKARLVREVVAALGLSASQLHMKVGYLGFSDRVEMLVPPRQGGAVIRDILSHIPRSRRDRRSTGLEPVLEALTGRLRATSVIFLISDFISLEGVAGDPAMRHLASRQDLIPVVVEDPLEQAMPALPGMHCIEDPESGRRRMVRWSPLQAGRYRDRAEARRDALTGLFWDMGLDFLWIDPAEDDYLDRVLEFFIRRRRAS